MLVKIQNLKVSYGKRNILKDVSLAFLGGLHFITGLNGSGKTTLLNAISGAIPYKGSIKLGEMEVNQLNPKMRARTLAVVPQQFQSEFAISVYDFVLMGRFPWLGFLGQYSQDDHHLTQKTLGKLNIDQFAERNLDQLSGGERQKCLIARALVQETPIILLDEPAHSLDPPNKTKLYQLIAALADGGKTVICTTHDREPIENLAAHIVGIRQGSLVIDLQEGGENVWEMLHQEVYREIVPVS